jgi:hypothetical protein
MKEAMGMLRHTTHEDQSKYATMKKSFHPAIKYCFWIFVILFIVPSIVSAQTLRYVDPLFVGATRNGTSTNPWQSLTDGGASTPPWTQLDTDLIGADTTVYFSARIPTADTDEFSAVPIVVSRTNGSTHVLTFDGKSQYQTNSNHSTNATWSAYSGNSRSRIETPLSGFPLPITTAGGGLTTNYFTVNGMKFVSKSGQIVNLATVSHLRFTNNEAYLCNGDGGYSVANNVATTTVSGTGSGLTVDITGVNDEGCILSFTLHSVGSGYQACNSAPSTCSEFTVNGGSGTLATGRAYSNGGVATGIDSFLTGPGVYIGANGNDYESNWGSHIVMDKNHIHHTFGEAFYVGGTSPDPANGDNYSTGIHATTAISGIGTGLTVNILQVGPSTGGIQNFLISNGGINYVIGDIILVNGGIGPARYEVYAVSGGAVTVLSQRQAGDDIVISNNTIDHSATQGGQGDGTDIKDGNTNVQIIGNYYD